VTTLLEELEELKRKGDHASMTAAIPYARFLGFSIDDSTGELLGRLTYADSLVGNPALPALHGGTLGALLESTAIFQLVWDGEVSALPKTINITVDYLRTGRPLDTWAKGVVTRRGRRVANVRAEAWQEDRARPIAIAYAHFLIAPG